MPKSGEVWCEGARIFLNPHAACFDLHVARRLLNFAIEFTPQYGDSFIEYLRLQMLVHAPEARTPFPTRAPHPAPSPHPNPQPYPPHPNPSPKP